MSPEPRPAAVDFDPGSGEIPPTLGPTLTEPDTPILLLVAAEADDAAARTAIGLADARARSGGDTVLADLGLEDPRLHRLLDVQNLEGVADLFLFGASLRRVTSRPDTRRFEFISAGAYAPDVPAVLKSPRWDRLAEEFEAGRSLLMVYVPANTPGLPELSRRAGRAVLIAEDRTADRAAGKLDPSCEVVAVVRPATGMAPDRLAAQARTAPDQGSATIFDDPELSEPVVFRTPKQDRRRTSPVLLVLLLIALGAGGWFLYQEYLADYIAGRSATAAAAPARVAATAPTDPGEPVETPIPVSVAVEAHQDLGSARARLAALRRAEPNLGFYLAPVAVNDVVYFRVLAGPAADRETGVALMQRLVDAGHKSGMDDWAVRPTSLSFRLGEFDTQEAARARVAELEANDIPAYVVPIRYTAGPVRFRVYGGAYESTAEAQVMEQMLKDAGETARLEPRTGEPLMGLGSGGA